MMKPGRLTCKLILSKLLLLCATVAALDNALAQGPSLALASGSGAPGGSVALNLNFQANGTQPTGIQWVLSFSSTDISSVTVAATSTATSVGEALSCSTAAGHVNCLMINLASNTVVVPNGTIAIATFHISPTTTSTASQISLTNLAASDGNGSSLSLSGTGGQITINQPPPVTSLSNLSCTPASIATPGTATCTVSLTAAAATNTTVALSSNSSYAAVPPSVVVPSGMSSATFTANASAVSGNTTATLTASLNGNVRNFSLALTKSSVTQPGVSSLTCSPISPAGGASVNCTVNLTGAAPSGGTTVTLSSDNAYAVPPNQVTIPAGLSNGVFTVVTTVVTAVHSSTISASSAGVTQSTVLTIQPPAGTSLSSLSCNPAIIGPGGTSSCTLTITGSAPSGGISIAINSSSSSVNVPNSVLIPLGSNSATFNATAGTAAADVNATLTATLHAVSTSFQLTVTSQTLLVSVNCNPATVAPGASSTCTASLNRTVQSGIVEVLLSSSNPKVTVPGSVVISTGNRSATFAAASAANASNDSANLSATLGATTVTTTLTIGANPNAPSLVCNPSILQTPGTTTCTFKLSVAPQTNLLVAMTSTNSSLIFPPSITIGTGMTTVTFTLTAPAVTASTTATLTAMGQGASQTLTLNPPPNTNVSVTAISCGPQTLTGGGTSTCNITLSGAAPVGGVHVQLSSSSTQVSVPTFVQVPELSSAAEFALSSSLIDHDENITLTANLASSSAQTKLSLAGLKLVSLACTPKSLRSGSPFTCQATFNSAQATGGVVLSLSSSDSRVTVPASVSSQAGQAVFQANTTVVPVNQSVKVSASYHGVTVQDTVTLTPGPPVLTAPGRQMILPGKLLTFTVSASDPANLAVALSSSGLPPGAMFNPNGGIFNWVPQTSQIGVYTVHFTATNIALVSTTQDVLIEVASDTPVIFSIANAASYVDDGGCSPGAVTTIVGSGFVKTGPKAAEISPIPTEMNGVRVSVNGNDLPVFYAAENQINFQCPQLAPGDPVTLTIESNTGTSSPHSSKMQFATPGIFTIDGSGRGQGAILIANTPSIAMPHTDGIPSQPARHGDFVSIYATGLGSVSTEVPSGSAAPVETLDKVKAPVDVIIDGQNAEVSFAGLAPGFTGLYQVNAQIPVSASTGDTISVQIAVHLPDGTVAKSNIVSIAIAAAAN